MKLSLWMIMMMSCLTGCSELRVIGSAAMRELHAEAIPVNWNKSMPERTAVDRRGTEIVLADVKVKSFSTFRSSPMAAKRPVKGLWEQRGG